MGRRHATLAQWVAMRPLFEVCARETGYGGGGSRREAWWRQEAIEKQLQDNLADSQEAKGRRRIGGEMGIQQELEQEGIGRTGWVVGMLGRRRETPKWANKLVCQKDMLGRRQGTPRWADELMW